MGKKIWKKKDIKEGQRNQEKTVEVPSNGGNRPESKVEGPIKGGNKLAQNEFKVDKIVDTVLSGPKIIEVEGPMKIPGSFKANEVDILEKKIGS